LNCQIQVTEIAALPIYSNFLYSVSSKSFFLQGTEIAALPEIITFIVSKNNWIFGYSKYWLHILTKVLFNYWLRYEFFSKLVKFFYHVRPSVRHLKKLPQFINPVGFKFYRKTVWALVKKVFKFLPRSSDMRVFLSLRQSCIGNKASCLFIWGWDHGQTKGTAQILIIRA